MSINFNSSKCKVNTQRQNEKQPTTHSPPSMIDWMKRSPVPPSTRRIMTSLPFATIHILPCQIHCFQSSYLCPQAVFIGGTEYLKLEVKKTNGRDGVPPEG